jgi:hypothetical protein
LAVPRDKVIHSTYSYSQKIVILILTVLKIVRKEEDLNYIYIILTCILTT